MRLSQCLFALILPLSAQAAVYTVGSDGSCTHTTIQAAITSATQSAGADTIRIARNQSYTQQALVITSQTLTITGGSATCAALPDGSITLISGAGGAASPVMRITTSGDAVVTLQYVQITGGDVGGNNLGGGILYEGSNNSWLETEHSTISGNSAAYGGGIYAYGNNGARALLILGANTLVASNSARISGGGIYLSSADLEMEAPDSAIANNTAADFGGGLRALGPSLILIASGGVSTLGTIFGNQARVGGGMALQGSAGAAGHIELEMTTADPLRPVRIRGNLASERGGALHIRPDYDDGTSSAHATLAGVSIEENSAPTGAVAYLDYSSDATGFVIGSSLTMTPAEGCAASSACNRVINNVSETIGGVATNDGIVLAADGSFIRFDGTQMLGNNGGPPIYSDDRTANFGKSVYLDHVVIANNVVRGDAVVRVFSGLGARIRDTTIAHNTLTGSSILNIAGETELDRSILWQPGKTTLITSTRDVGHVLASELPSLGTALLAINGEPRFVDPGNNNFRLRAGSRAIDIIPASAGNLDADGLPRDVDIELIADALGTRDLGAFERQTLLPLVQNGDFASDTRLWPEVVNNSSVFQNEDFVLSPSSGSLRVFENGGSIATLQSRRQCVSLPAPSSYRLNAAGRGYSTGLFRDTLSLQWRLRANSSDCTGGVISEGTLAIPNNTTWASAAQPANIPLSSTQWTFNSTLEIILVATDDRPLPPNNIDVAFDQIVLVPGAVVNSIFANGFE